MNTTSINVLSAAIGALALSLVIVSTGATAPPLAGASSGLRIAGIPAPKDMVTIIEGTDYQVPAGRLFVVTGVSRDTVPLTVDSMERVSAIQVWFDSEPALSVHVGASRWQGNRGQFSNEGVVAVPPGLVADGGMTVSVTEATYEFAGVASTPVASGVRGMLYGYVFDPAQPSRTIDGIPSPTQMRRVVEGAALTVPLDMRFVVTGVARDRVVTTVGPSGTTTTQSIVQVLFGAQTVAALVVSPSGLDTSGYAPAQAKSIQRVPPGLVARASMEVSVSESSWIDQGSGPPSLLPTDARGVVLGYLAED